MLKQSLRIRGFWGIGTVFVWTAMCFAQSSGPDSAHDAGTAPRTGLHASGTQLASKRTHRASLSARKGQITGPASGSAPLPAVVSFEDGALRIVANGADLGELLKRVSAISGMTVDGLARPGAVSGSYGPGKPREVLAQLLENSQYGFVMVGASPGEFPRDLVLTSRTAPPAPASSQGQQASSVSGGHPLLPSVDGTPVAAANDRADAEGEAPSSSEPLGPGAMAHVPPNEAENAGAEDAGARMQQHLQKLQQLQQRPGGPQ